MGKRENNYIGNYAGGKGMSELPKDHVKARSLSTMSEFKPKVDFHPVNPHVVTYKKVKSGVVFDVNQIARFKEK